MRWTSPATEAVRTMDWALKTRFALWASIVLLACVPVCAQEKSVSSPTPRAAAAANEVRALWVVRTTLTSPEKIRTMVQSAKENGFNTLIVQVLGLFFLFYPSPPEFPPFPLQDPLPV